jgi:hippurate hydrolase
MLLALRRAIHSEPELGLDCPRTRDKLEATLANHPLTIRRSERPSGFVAELEGALPGRSVLLRGDMDALPIHEATGLAFASRDAGRMHACGHDSHSAMLASAARILCGQRDRIAGRILFMFQPGEEGHHGARIMLEEGLLGDPLPDAAFALHIWPTLPHGAVACRAGAMLASTDTLKTRIVGRGGHAAMPHDAIDPVPVAAEVVLALQAEVARRTPVTDPIVLSISCINAGQRTTSCPTRRTARHAPRPVARGPEHAAARRSSALHPCCRGAWVRCGSGDRARLPADGQRPARGRAHPRYRRR